jgi:predicted metalloprotease with PDZ domain
MMRVPGRRRNSARRGGGVAGACALAVGAGLALAAAPAGAQVRYTVAVPDPGQPYYRVTAEFPDPGDTLLVSLPAWTPGHYVIENYARYVRSFEARDARGRPLDWDKLDKDTWRVAAGGAGPVRVTLEVWADTLELSMSRLTPEFGFFNGTNLFLFREARFDEPAEVRFALPPGWRVATPLEGGPDLYRAPDYHALVDAPTFVGRFALDSLVVDGARYVVAVHPDTLFRDPARARFLDGLRRIAEAQHALFGGPAWSRYVVLVLLVTEPIPFAGGLEHANAHLDILPASAFADASGALGPFVLPLVAHELFHAWNVKRIRPAELWPYDYRVEQFTPSLWFSEGVTEYYAHVSLVRAGLWDGEGLRRYLEQSLSEVESEERPVAVEDASLDAWIEPVFTSPYSYYPKGALLGFWLDVRIRAATDNGASLDDVLRALYREFYARGRGFRPEELWALLARHLGAREARAFYEAYVDGREPLPYAQAFAEVGLRYVRDSVVEPFLGVFAVPADEGRGVRVLRVEPGSSAAEAGLRPGDVLLSVGGVRTDDALWGARFRGEFRGRAGVRAEIVFERDGEERRVQATVRTRTLYRHRVVPQPDADPRAVRIWEGILRGVPPGP